MHSWSGRFGIQCESSSLLAAFLVTLYPALEVQFRQRPHALLVGTFRRLRCAVERAVKREVTQQDRDGESRQVGESPALRSKVVL